MPIDNLLLIDDDDLGNQLVSIIISDIPQIKNIKIDSSGWSALDYLEQCQKSKTFPDLLLVDLKMPEMDGFEFIENYEERYFSQFPKTKVVILTSSIRDKDKNQSLGYKSVSDFMQKPLTEDKLLGLLDKLNKG